MWACVLCTIGSLNGECCRIVVASAYYVKFANIDNCANLLTVSLQCSFNVNSMKQKKKKKKKSTQHKNTYIWCLFLARCRRFQITVAYALQRSKGVCQADTLRTHRRHTSNVIEFHLFWINSVAVVVVGCNAYEYWCVFVCASYQFLFTHLI